MGGGKESRVFARMEVEFPDDFKCPISLEIMSDPVILSSGHTFDRSSIQRWLDSGNRTCPVTKLPLPPHPSLIPNHALRSLISNFAPTASSKPQQRHSPPPPPPPNSTPETLVSTLAFPSDLQTLAQVHRLCKRSSGFRRLLADSGAASRVLLRHAGCGDHRELREAALRIVLDLSLDGDDIKVGLVAEGAVDRVVAALQEGAPSCRALAATTLTSLAMVDVNKCTIGAHPSAIRGLVAVLRDGKGRERREAATALYVLCSFPENRRRAITLGAVPVLIELAGSGVERAIEVLGLLGKCKEGREEMEKVDGFIRVLAEVLRKGSLRGAEHTLLVLSLMCSANKGMALEAINEGLFEVCMDLVGEENGKIGKNASILVSTLQRTELDGIF